jgi:hypothetical protein
MNYASPSISGAKRMSSRKHRPSWRVRLAHWLIGTEDNQGAELASMHDRDVRSIDRGDGTVTFTIHPASGGYVVESNYYDDRNDRHQRSLHIITSQEDFSQELGKAVFMDILKNR